MTQPDFAVVCWRWKPTPGYRSSFGPETVNILRRMVSRHLKRQHRFICVTDDPAGLDPSIEVIPLWNDHAKVPNPSGPLNPSCYRRLRLFHPDAAQWFGPRFVSLDLDMVITGDLGDVWGRPEDFVIYGDTNPTTPYNGSMILMSAGARPKVWTEFDPVDSPRRARSMGYFGSDQAWIGCCLGPNERKWSRNEGVYSYRNEIGPLKQELPINCKVVIMHGQHDPWGAIPQQQEWCRKHYR